MSPPPLRVALGVVALTLALALAPTLRAADPVAPAKDGAHGAATGIDERVANLESQVATLKQSVQQAGNGVVLGLFVFAVFCAVWAQNTNRSAVLWFVLGFLPLINFFTAIVLLAKNSRDRKRLRQVVPPVKKEAVPELVAH